MSLVRDGRTLAVPAHLKGTPYDADAAKHALNIDRRTCKREVPMKVLILGLPRTGTVSLRHALFQLGYFDVYHGVIPWAENPPDADMWIQAFKGKYEGGRKFEKKDWDSLLGHCMAVSDSPCINFADDLISTYPEAKVILTVRDNAEVWRRSMEPTFLAAVHMHSKKSYLNLFLSRFKTSHPLQELGSKMMKYSRYLHCWWDFQRNYDDHNAWIQRLISDQKNILVFNVKEGWKPLCKFLNEDVPPTDFPHMNDTKVFASHFARFEKASQANAYKKTFTISAIVLVLAFVIWLWA